MYMAGMMGLVLGSMNVEYILALAIIALGLMIQTAYRVLLGGADSHYQRYLSDLAKRQPLPLPSWIGYLAQMVAFGSAIGTGTFGLGRFFL